MIILSMIRIFAAVLLLVSVLVSNGHARLAVPNTTTEAQATSPIIVIGFVGGFIKHDDPVHSVVQVAARLRKEYGASTVVETFENRNGEKAYRQVIAILDANHDGTLSPDEKRNARVILYGHSWGGSESITLARRLEQDNVPILLTVQVDSVAKIGEDDVTIPANVAQAANFYQSDGLLRGEPEIHAGDPAHTRILGNFRFRYAAIPYNCTDYPWYTRIFMKAHIQIECDPKVWNQVESLIRSYLPPASANGLIQ
jgi:hypothetical protein